MLLKPLTQRVNSVYLRGSNSHLITAPIDALANRGCFFLYVPPLLNRETVSDLTRRTPANSSLFTRNRGGLPGSGATFDASLPSFHAATHFFFRLYRSFYTRPWLLHQRISLIFAFLSRGEAFFIVSATTFSHETKPFLS